MRRRCASVVVTGLNCVVFLWSSLLLAQQHSAHHDHRMSMNQQGMVMNNNESNLPRDCPRVVAELEFAVKAGARFAKNTPGSVFGYDRNSFEAEPCSLIRVSFTNEDEVRHQWMVHGLPRYLYPGGMFHLEASGGSTVSGSFIVPSDRKTYLVHCDITQHMEKGMKAQLKVGGGSGNLWAVPGTSREFLRANYLPEGLGYRLLALVLAPPLLVLLARMLKTSRSRRR